LIFKSKFSGFRVKVRSESRQIHGATGVEIGKTPSLVAEFGQFGPEFEFTAPDGSIETGANIVGHYFDTDEATERLNWSPEEKEAVEKVLLMWCGKWPESVWLHSEAPAAKPWPTYDEAHHKSIPGLAEQLGLVAEALAYEQQNKKRTEVVEKLSELLNAPAVEDALTAA
jgi:hypothetical protein